MFEHAQYLTDERFADRAPVNVFHKENEPFRSIHDPELRNRHILFRRTFILDTLPAKAVFHLTADDYYKLYVNGSFVTQGPAAGYPFHYYYNSVDITPYLVPGRNVIAVHTYYQGLTNRVWVSADQRHMMICELRDGEKTILVSDTEWKCTEHTGYSSSHTIGYETQFAEDYDSRSPEEGFQDPGYDDSAWGYAKEKKYTDYILFPQPSEQLAFEKTKPARIVRTKTENGGELLFGDFGFEAVGYLCLCAKGVGGSTVTVRCGEERLSGEDGAYIDRVRYLTRCNCEYEEAWTLSGGCDTLTPYDYKAFRYFELLLPAGCTVKDEDITFSVRHYPYREAVSCPTDDPVLSRIWRLCADTLRYGAQEAFMDCPTREKGQYLNDCTVSAEAYTRLTGDGTLMKKALYDYARSSFITPTMMTVAPSAYMQEIADASMQYPGQMLFLWRETHDTEMLSDLLPYAEAARDRFRSFDRGDGLLSGVDTWNLIDWPENLRDDYDFPAVKPIGPGAHNVMNAFWYGMNRDIDEIRRILGLPCDSSYTEKLADAYVSEFYDQDRHLFTDAKQTSHASVHSNLLPLYFDLDRKADPAARKAIVSLLREKGLCMGVSMAYFLLMGLKQAGEDALVKELLKSPDGWSLMLSEGATTTFEAWGRDKKWNTSFFHPWACAPILVLTGNR